MEAASQPIETVVLNHDATSNTPPLEINKNNALRISAYAAGGCLFLIIIGMILTAILFERSNPLSLIPNDAVSVIVIVNDQQLKENMEKLTGLTVSASDKEVVFVLESETKSWVAITQGGAENIFDRNTLEISKNKITHLPFRGSVISGNEDSVMNLRNTKQISFGVKMRLFFTLTQSNGAIILSSNQKDPLILGLLASDNKKTTIRISNQFFALKKVFFNRNNLKLAITNLILENFTFAKSMLLPDRTLAQEIHTEQNVSWVPEPTNQSKECLIAKNKQKIACLEFLTCSDKECFNLLTDVDSLQQQSISVLISDKNITISF